MIPKQLEDIPTCEAHVTPGGVRNNATQQTHSRSSHPLHQVHHQPKHSHSLFAGHCRATNARQQKGASHIFLGLVSYSALYITDLKTKG